MSPRKKKGSAPAPAPDPTQEASDTIAPPEGTFDAEVTVNLTGDVLPVPLRDDTAPQGPDTAETEAAQPVEPDEPPDTDTDAEAEAEAEIEQARELSRAHLCGLLEALVFASDKPMKAIELARLASAPVKQVRALLPELREAYAGRGIVLDEVAGGWLFRTSVQFAPFVRELSAQRPVRLTRAQVETLAIIAYRQPITRPEIDDVRGVDSGATLKLLLERDLVRILGKKDEPGRPLLYGTTTQFLEFFGMKSLKDLPTLHEFTELNEESRRIAEAELGEVIDTEAPPPPAAEAHDTIAPPPPPATQDEIDGAGAPSDSKIEDPPE